MKKEYNNSIDFLISNKNNIKEEIEKTNEIGKKMELLKYLFEIDNKINDYYSKIEAKNKEVK